MSNEILKFASTDTGTNLLTQGEYVSDVQRPIGHQPGVARDKFANKVLRQTSFISKVFADYLIQQTGGDVLDDADDSVLLAKITQCFATGLPVASVIKMTTPVVPTGFLKTNGAEVSRTTYLTLFEKLVTNMGFSLETFTVSLASPAVVTKSGHGFKGGERLRFSTTGLLPTGLNTSEDYFVSYVDANTFKLQNMSGVISGTFINTSGSQSGVHSYLQSLWGLGNGSTTFNVPDLRGVFERAWDDGRGLDPNRAIASFQKDMFKSHSHEVIEIDAPGSLVYNVGSGPYQNRSGAQTGLSGGVETRPINNALMPVIKY